MSKGMSTFLAYQREVCNQYSNCLLVTIDFCPTAAELIVISGGIRCPGKCTISGGDLVSGKVHYEHILATKVLMPMGGGGGGGEGVSGKVHYEHILATKVLMPVGGGWGGGVLGVWESAL